MSRNHHKKEYQVYHTVVEWLWYSFIMAVSLLIIMPHSTQAFVVLFTQETEIVSQIPFDGSCVDGAKWTSSPGACDEITCHVEPSGNYTVSHSCPSREPYENPDSVNCEWVSNTTLAFPDCCPDLQCAPASAIPTVNPVACLDIASSFACGVWKNLTSGCSDPTSDVYNITQIYCNNTCGYC